MIESYEKKLEFNITNLITGEISELSVNNETEAKNLYLKVQKIESDAKKIKSQLASYLMDFLGDDDKYEFVDGVKLVKNQREVKTWRPEALREIGFDDDLLMIVSKINMTEARKIVDEMIEKGEVAPNTKKILNESADVNTSAPFITLR